MIARSRRLCGDPALRLNHDGPDWIKLYQFDPMHHDVAVYSLH